MKKIYNLILVIVLIIGMGGILVLNFVNVNYNPSATLNAETKTLLNNNQTESIEKPDMIKVYSNSTSYKTYFAGEEEFEKFFDLYKASFKVALIDAIFQNSLNKESKIESMSSKKIASLVKDNNYYVEFVYNNIQTLVNPKGEIHLTQNNSRVYYLSLLLEVQNSTKVTETTIYVRNTVSNQNSRSSSSYYGNKIVTYSIQSDLYNYINKNIVNK